MVSSRKNRRIGGGQQPLAYIDPSLSTPSASSGSNLLEQQGVVLRPRLDQQGGGSVQQPLSYMDPTIASPSAIAGGDLLQQQGLVIRPRIGGFLPTIMKGVVNSGAIVAPLAVFAARRMMNTKKRRGGGKKEEWAQNRERAREELVKYGKPSALNINKFAALQRKDREGADQWITEYILRKRTMRTKSKKQATTTVKNTKASTKPLVTAELWKDLVDRAKLNLSKFGKPSGPNLMKYASLRKKAVNTTPFLANFKTRKQYKSPEKTPRNKYQANLSNGRQYLSQFGKPTVANVSKFVSLKRKGLSTVNIETAVKQRVKPQKKKAFEELKRIN